MKYEPSKAAVAEKAQHDPHCPWFWIGLTAPLVLQSIATVDVEVELVDPPLVLFELLWASRDALFSDCFELNPRNSWYY